MSKGVLGVGGRAGLGHHANVADHRSSLGSSVQMGSRGQGIWRSGPCASHLVHEIFLKSKTFLGGLLFIPLAKRKCVNPISDIPG